MISTPLNSTKSDASHFAGIGHATPEIGASQLGNSQSPKSAQPGTASAENRNRGAATLVLDRTPLSVADIQRALLRYRYDPEHRWGRQGATRANVAALARLAVTQLKEAERGRMTASTRIMLSHAIRAFESGRVKFHRTGGPAKGQPRWTIEYRDPPARRPPPEDKLTRAMDHREWSQCRTCQGDRWQAISMNGQAWVACAQCIPKLQWPAIGAKAG
jgi:hypothetical protein